MSTPNPDVLAVLREFVERIDALDPGAPLAGELAVGFGDRTQRLELRAPVARALVEALLSYHDPRDRGCCERCGSRRLDDYFLCADCGNANGLFGRLIAERAASNGWSPGDADR